MSPNCASVVSYPCIVAQQLLSTLVSSAGWYSAVFDPRPDLSVPARSVKLPYAWWW
jgi:hypothetical protein